jgi:WD40-like Beta Propeller Repeat
MTSTPRSLRRAAALAGLCLAVTPAVAAADSIVFVKDSNVWLAKPDGSGQYQVTADGTYASPYRSPSQADDGTIAVGKGNEIVRMRQNGTVLNRLDPPPLENSISHPMDGAPVDVAISPDGSRIAYTFAGYECGGGTVSCMTRYATGYTAADHLTPPEPAGTTFFSNPSWITSTRTLQFGGFGSQVNIHDVGAASAVHWFDDSDYASGEDLGDGELSRDGTEIALVRSYGENAHLIWWKIAGNAHAGTPSYGDPASGCATGAQAGFEGPSWSPDGTQLAWKEVNPATKQPEIWVKPQALDCAVQPRLAIAGGSEPDWGPANVNPGPRDSGGGPAPGGGGGGGGGTPVGGTPGPVTTPALHAALAVKRVKLGAALKRGLTVSIAHAKPGRTTVVAKRGSRVVARATVKVGASGSAKVRLRFTAAGRRALRRAANVRLTITGAGAKATVTLRR